MTYSVRVETDSDSPEAQKLRKEFIVMAHSGPEGVVLHGQAPEREMEGRLWITLDVTVPSEYNLDVATGAGNVECDDVTGRVVLQTDGGNITAGNVDGTAHLETQGGHIIVRDVTGDLSASTGGGHITAAHIGGGAMLHTDGGHIRLASVGRIGKLETMGGNISIQQAGAELFASTGGGQIEVGEASGSIRARTGGGGIRVARVAGPTQLDTGAGSIYLTQVLSPVHATTGAGAITAWINADAKLTQITEFESGEGDIVVYLPKLIPVTIDAQIAMGDEHHFIADPAFPVKVTYLTSDGGVRTVHAEGALNGGGMTLRLRTTAGNIRLVLSDTCLQLQQQVYKQQMEQLKRQLRRMTPAPAAQPAPQAQPPAAAPPAPPKPDKEKTNEVG